MIGLVTGEQCFNLDFLNDRNTLQQFIVLEFLSQFESIIYVISFNLSTPPLSCSKDTLTVFFVEG